MKKELLALMPADATLPDIPVLSYERAEGFVAVLAPAPAKLALGRALRKTRLNAASERQSWLEALLQGGTVLHVAPGTVMDRDQIAPLLAANTAMLAPLMAALRDLVQYQVSVTWAEDLVLRRFRDAPEIAPLFAAGAVSATAVAASVARLSTRLAGGLSGQLAEVADDLAELPLDRGMIFNAVLLIRREREGALDRVLAEIDRIWTEGFRIRQIGPGPATSFATLRVLHHGAAEVAQAYQTLGLSAPATEACIQTARQRLLRQPGANAERIRFAQKLVEADRAAGRPASGVHLITRWSEGRAAAPLEERVA